MSEDLPIETMSKRAFDDLPDYSCTIPTGVRAGKKWKRREPYMDNPENKYTWYLGEYCKHPTDDTKCLLRWSLIKVNEK